MALSQRLNEKRTQMKENRMEKDLDRAEQEAIELKTENRTLRDEVERSADERDHLVNLLEKMERTVAKNGKKRHRGRKVAFLGLGGLAAWAFGTQSGREKVARLKDRAMSDPTMRQYQEQATDIAHQTKGAATDIARQTKDAAKDIAQQSKGAASDIAQQTKDAAKDAGQQAKGLS
jgi:hypothetical protein